MTSENLVLNGDFANGLAAWRDASKLIKVADVRGKKAALFRDRGLPLWQTVGGKKIGRFLGPGTYTCRFLANRDGNLSAIARVEAMVWDGGNLIIGGGAGDVVKMEGEATDWVAGSFSFRITQERSWVNLGLSSSLGLSDDDESEHVGVAITAVELVKTS